jgi:beta-galactosidase
VLDGTYYCSTNKDVRSHGYLPLEVAWYRKHLFIPQSDQGKILQLEFGGIYRDSQVWLNGQLLGRHPGGYTSFFYDITRLARCGETNVITVRVDPRAHEGWWYEGGGIYRHVYLTATAPLHVANYGTYVISKVPGGNEGASAEAGLTLQTTVENSAPLPANCGVVSEIFGPDGALLKTVKTCESVGANAQKLLVQNTVLPQPRLWSVESPQLYTLHTTVLQDGKPVDSTTTTFGIRTIRFDAVKGFFLNGKHVEIHGVANHQDFSAAGIAVPDSLQPWRVNKLKEMGCNGWRTAHNEPNEEVLDACDRLGMLVMAENRHLGDSYEQKTVTGTAATDLSDLATMIQRDRNHPSIIFWSMSNEEKLETTPEGAQIHLAMKKVVQRYDQTRPISCAMVFIALTNGAMDVQDLIGINYNEKKYDEIHKAHPHQPMYCSEGLNQKSARGNYLEDTNHGWASAYNLSDKSWQAVASRPFMAGAYVWTGFDYRGEPNPFGWPDISNNTGLLDVCGFPKDKGYYFKSCWTDKPMVHLMPMTWNWPGKEGQKIRVIAFSNARQVELSLNGQSLGVKKMPRNGHVEWAVPYVPGRLVAKASTDGRLVATDQIETTDAARAIQVSPDRTTLHADGADTLVVPVSILDDKGRLVDATNRVSFQLSGNARILGVGNGNPSDHDPDRATQRNAFHGHCMVLIQAGATRGTLQLTATSPGLKPANITLRVE